MSKRWMAVVVVLVLVVGALGSAVAEDVNGADVYNKKCGLCHGKDGVAKKMAEGSANLNDAAWQEANSVEQIVKVTAEGVADSKMKGFKDKLSDAEIQAIAEYIKTLK